MFINRIKTEGVFEREKMIKRTGKYFAPQNGDVSHVCDCPGCNEKGEYRAPKDRNLKEYYWFCLKHVQEYNAKWNYYADGGNPDEDEIKQKRFKKHFRSKVRYQFGYDLWEEAEFFADGYANNTDSNREYSEDGVYFTTEERKFVKTLEMDIWRVTPENVKKQYKILAKKYHPDINRDDENAEEKFKQISAAYHALMEKFSRLPNYD